MATPMLHVHCYDATVTHSPDTVTLSLTALLLCHCH